MPSPFDPASSLSRLRGTFARSTALFAPSALALVLMPVLVAPAVAKTSPPSAMDLPPVTVRAATPTAAAAGPGADTGNFSPADIALISGSEAQAATLWTSDSGSLINRVPGGAAWGAGGVSSLPAVNGMAADRVQVAVNGMLFGIACPNQMNPPFSFVNPAMIANVKVYTATAPVSVGGD